MVNRCSIFCLVILLVSSMSNAVGLKAADPSISTSVFGKLPDGQEIIQFTLRNNVGAQAKVIEYGAILVELQVPDREGKFASVVLGADSLEKYSQGGFPAAAAVIGRYANRIRGAKFMLDGKEIAVAKNAGQHHIHGGSKNFTKVRWIGSPKANSNSASVSLKYTSADGEEGFPGTLSVTVSYELNNQNELILSYEASTDKTTVINLTNHAYFNLAGAGGDVLGHELQVMSAKTTAIDEFKIPTGPLESVEGTPLDFRQPKLIGDRIAQLHQSTGGYDHNYVLDGAAGTLRMAARASESTSGRVMECLTTEPGVQLYTANHFKDNPFPKHGAFCLETQHYPDSPNHPEFPTTIIRPGENWSSKTVFRFSVNK
jgi:aldose 1-epimerase